jgi:hypothetical protein
MNGGLRDDYARTPGQEKVMTMQSKILAKSEWQSALDRISRIGTDLRASIIVSGQVIGVQTEADDVPLIGISYDPHDDAVSVETEGLDHRIAHPSQIDLAYDGHQLSSMEIVAKNNRHIVSFNPALTLAGIHRL